MPNTYVLISSATATGGGQAAFTFSSIPSTYTDLLIKMSLRNNSNEDSLFLTINGTTGLLSFINIYTYCAAPVSTSASGSGSSQNSLELGGVVTSTYTASVFSNVQIYFPNYSNTSFNKSLAADTVVENNGAQAQRRMTSGLWSSTNAISSITLTNQTGANLVAMNILPKNTHKQK
jgi:hypothetical protein